MKLFDIVPEGFFRLLSRSNKALYAEALFVLYEVFQRSHIFIHRSELVSAISAHLCDMIFAMEEEEGEEIGEQFSARVNFVVRQLEDFGWIERDDNFDLNKYVIPGYALKILQAMYEVMNFKPQNYNSLVFGTYSVLLTADMNKDNYFDAINAAYRNTVDLKNNLKSLLMNMKQYHKMLMQQTEVRKIVEQHFDSYAQAIDLAAYHPLKTIDSIPRFRNKIIEIIEKWENEEATINLIAREYAEANKADIDTAVKATYQMIHDIIDIYLGIDEINREIDTKHKSYVRASHERIRTLLYTDKSIKGMLVEILNNLPKLHSATAITPIVDMLNEGSPLYSAQNLSEQSLYVNRVKRERGNEQPLKEVGADAYKEAFKTIAGIQESVNLGLVLMDVNNYVKEVLENRKYVSAEDISIDNMHDFMRLVYAIIKQQDSESEYFFEFYRRKVWVGNAYLPDFVLALKATNNDNTNVSEVRAI